MVKNKTVALFMLFFILIILGHSVICLFQGKFQQAMVMTPLLILVYVFGMARKEPKDQGSDYKLSSEDLEEDHDQK